MISSVDCWSCEFCFSFSIVRLGQACATIHRSLQWTHLDKNLWGLLNPTQTMRFQTLPASTILQTVQLHFSVKAA